MPIDLMEPVLLCSIADDVNATILVATLEENEIPIVVKKQKAGGYLSIYMGMNAYGVDIYVPAYMLDNAQMILNGITSDTGDPVEQDDGESNRSAKNRRIKMWLLLAIMFGVPLLLVYLAALLFGII